MKKNDTANRPFSSLSTRSFHAGGYSVAAAVIVLAIAVAVNALVGNLPSTYTKLDTTANGLYTVSEQTEKVLSGLDEDIDIYWIVRSGYEDSNIATLLDRYSSLSDKIRVTKKDPDVYPTFAKQYYDGQLYNNSLVVCRGDRYRYIDYNSIYEYDYSDYYSGGSVSQNFAGEGELTSAISYVVNDAMPTLYILTGHGEAELSSTFKTAIEKQNIQTESLSLLTVEAVPEDAGALLINTPQSDISEDEAQKIADYLASGGRLMLVTDPPKDGALTNLEALMAGYGVEAVDGIVVEANQNNYAWGTPYYLLPDLKSHSITEPLIDGGYYVLLSIAHGLRVSDTLPDGVTVDTLLSTSSSAYSKAAGYDSTTYEKEDGDIDGAFALGAAVTAENDDGSTAQIVWVSSGALLDEQSSSMVSGGNLDLFLNAISWMCGHEDGISIHSKSMNYEYLMISSSSASVMTAVIIWLIPALFLGTGVCVWLRRRRK